MSYGGCRIQVLVQREDFKTLTRADLIERVFEPAIAALLLRIEKFPDDDTEVFVSITAQGFNDLDRAIAADMEKQNDES
jgi:hypothetical protein